MQSGIQTSWQLAQVPSRPKPPSRDWRGGLHPGGGDLPLVLTGNILDILQRLFSLFLFGFSACALLADENSADPVCRKSDKIFSSQWQTISPSATWLRGWPLNSLWRGGCQNRQGSRSPHRAMPAPRVFWSPARLHGDPSTQFSSWVVCPSPFPQAPLNVLSRLFSGIASMQLCFCSTGEPADLGAGCRAQIEEGSSGKRDKVMPTAGDTEGHTQILPGNSQKVQMPKFTGVQKLLHSGPQEERDLPAGPWTYGVMASGLVGVLSIVPSLNENATKIL